MASWKLFFLLPFIILSFSGCLGLPENTSSDELVPETASEDTVPEGGGADEFADFESPAAQSEPSTGSDAMDFNSQPEQAAASQAPAATEAPAEQSLSLDEPSASAAPADEFSEFEQPQPAPEVAQNNVTPAEPDEFDLENLNQEPPPVPTMEFSNQKQTPAVTSKVEDIDPFSAPELPVQNDSVAQVTNTSNLKIKSIQYKANDSGGAIVIQADGPISFTTRNNPETEQVIVEIPGAQLPDRLKRPFNMRDIRGAFGSLDPYQEKGSNVARFVVQLRPNTSDPFVVAEGDTLLIVADKSQIPVLTNNTVSANASNVVPATGASASGNNEAILTSRTLQEFLADNAKFYGKKVSIETASMAVRDALRFISEEGGVNMIIADNVSGNVSLKLRDIPWDQAFVIIMKSRNLGYIRQGNVLRVATLADLRTEEDATIKLVTDRLKIEPLVVRVFPINYAKVDDLATKIKDFLTDRGKVIGDPRTNSIVITDIPQSLARIEQLVQNLDTQPPQVLIEGRIIEATDSFQRQVGINWGFSGSPYKVGTGTQGDVTIRPSLSISPGQVNANSGGSLGFQLGTLDIFGSISATLSLAEIENKIRILSSPRIVTLSNEKATITQTIQRPYTTTTVTPGAPAISTVTFKNLELLLDVTPQITSDASVIMSIKVKRDLVGESVNGNASIESREANTKVMVKNGQTSVIGGVYQNDSSNEVSGVPWLKDIPVLGSLFRFSDTKSRRTELMIFLTPRIVSAGSESIAKPVTN